MERPYTKRTPWGFPNHSRCLAYDAASGNGIYHVETPSHGGFIVEPYWNDKIRRDWREASFCGDGLRGIYEEDCDAAIVILSFPDLFGASDLRYAHDFYNLATFGWVARTRGLSAPLRGGRGAFGAG